MKRIYEYLLTHPAMFVVVAFFSGALTGAIWKMLTQAR